MTASKRIHSTITYLEVTFNSPPTDIQLSNHTVPENSLAGTEIGLLTATDPDPDETFTFTLSGTDAEAFFVQENDLLTKRPLDYETKSLYTFLIHVTKSSGGTFSKSFTIQVLDVNEPPIIESFLINDGAASTSSQKVTIKTLITDPDSGDSIQMRLSNVENEWTSAWMPYTPEYEWNLSAGEGLKTVYVQARDSAGLESQVVSRTIYLDQTPPDVTTFTINNGTAYTLSRDVDLYVDIGTSEASLPVQVSVSNQEDGPFTTWYDLLSPIHWQLTPGDGTKNVYAVFRDAAGNETAKQSATIILDTIAPVISGVSMGGAYKNDVTVTFSDSNGASATLNSVLINSGHTITQEGQYDLIVTDSAGNTNALQFIVDKSPPEAAVQINGGAAFTNQSQVHVTITATDLTSMRMSFANEPSGFTAEEPYVGTKTWNLSSGDGVKTVYVKLVDVLGHQATKTASIILDTTPPIVSGVTNQAVYNTDRTIFFSEGSATLNGQRIPNGHTVSLEGEYKLVVTDEAGNVTTVQFSIIKSTPVGGFTINNGSLFTASRDVTLQIRANGSADGLQMSYNTDGAWSTFEPFSSTKHLQLPGIDGTKSVSIKFRYQAGNESQVYTQSIILDTAPPSGSFAINNGAGTTSSPRVNLSISATDNLGQIEMRIANENSTWSNWQAYSRSVSWTLPNGNGPKKVLLELRDEAGNVTSLEKSIVLRVSDPTPWVPVTGISLDEDRLTLFEGEGRTLIATVFPSHATNKAVIWSSSDPHVAEVNGRGVVTAKNPGDAVIMATTMEGQKNASAKVTVKKAVEEVPVTGVKLDQDSLKLLVGETQKLKATVQPNDATNQAVIWSSSHPKVASVDEDGVVTSHKAGEATITVTTADGKKTDTAAITVRKKNDREGTLVASDSALWLYPGITTSVSIYYRNDGIRTKINRDPETRFHSENGLVTFENGRIKTGKEEGEDWITVSYLGEELTIPVTISRESIRSLSIDAGRNVILETGGEKQLRLYGTTKNGTDPELTDLAAWTSSDPDVARVTDEGEITAGEPGKATITARYSGQSVTVRVLVMEEKEIREIRLSPLFLNLEEGESRQLRLYAEYEKGYDEIVSDDWDWEIEDTSIATVKAGKVKALKTGETILTVRYEGFETQVRIVVR
ncbi:Ig-like domain-containing protein [Brevibacillus panacihumi]|uniref:Ig-like domain-containing protein n=1 Tax=Brevibacillus panacihumi TaxID=497735 RepID=UPI0003F64E8E|nr:Ig-like domain-containing protein [Brevibacillus panacihumi]